MNKHSFHFTQKITSCCGNSARNPRFAIPAEGKEGAKERPLEGEREQVGFCPLFCTRKATRSLYRWMHSLPFFCVHYCLFLYLIRMLEKVGKTHMSALKRCHQNGRYFLCERHANIRKLDIPHGSVKKTLAEYLKYPFSACFWHGKRRSGRGWKEGTMGRDFPGACVPAVNTHIFCSQKRKERLSLYPYCTQVVVE